MYIYTHIHTHTHIYIYIFIHIYIIDIYIYIYIYIYIFLGTSVNFVVTPIFANSSGGVTTSVWFGAGMCGLSFMACLVGYSLDWYLHVYICLYICMVWCGYVWS